MAGGVLQTDRLFVFASPAGNALGLPEGQMTRFSSFYGHCLSDKPSEAGRLTKMPFFEIFSKKGVDDTAEMDRLFFLRYGCEKESFPATNRRKILLPIF